MRRPSRNGSFQYVLTETTKRGLKRRVLREALNPRALKRARRDEPGALSPPQRPRQLQVVSVSNSQKCSSQYTSPTLFVWGCGGDGSLGLGPDHLAEVPRPRRLRFEGIVSIAAGGLYTLLLDRDGKVWSCGNNDNYALGRETEPEKHRWGAPDLSFDEVVSKPHVIPGLRCHKISSICAGNELSVAVSATGELFIWGAVRNSRGAITLPNRKHFFRAPTRLFSPTSNVKVSSVACGENHILIISTTGALYAWGANEGCQLGVASHGANTLGSPVKIILPHSRRVVRVAAGGMHSFAIDSVGDVWSWGLNFRGQTGIDTDEDRCGEVIETPRRVSTMCKGSPVLAGSRVVEIACGEFHSIFLLDDGRVFTCGAYDSGQLGLGPSHILASVNKINHPRVRAGIAVPREVRFPFPLRKRERIIGIEADSRRSMAWTESHPFVWGMGNVGELGLGPTIDEVFQPTLVDLAGWKPVQVSCGGQHTLALFAKN
ncbi:RCC1/BLIP-II [Thelephora ganbajun]|uniref:RCC1/BLIP-II n=1 Tax=Thelephora ganbajun TaxID=370292 RepID=A0ACB6ZDV4_THEGA|nr:RCC1/BLIP-II [Thelephora ganbajun]